MNRVLLAAGCFWGVQYYFDHIPGVIATTAGYTGGHIKNPTYEDVCYKNSGHAEAVLVEFDEAKLSFETIVKQFLYMHDPTQVGGQGVDQGDQYRSAIFYTSEQQKLIAQQVIKDSQSQYNAPIATELSAAGDFYPAEDYHQKFTERTGRGICHKPFKKM